ncbi:MAG: hypothetical protein JXR14_01985 [Paracoccaceae bacterium]
MRLSPSFLRILAVQLALITGLTACSNDLPDADRTISAEAQDAPFPQLLPESEIFPDASAAAARPIEDQARLLELRVALLQRKADALRGRDIYDGQDALRALR